MTAIRFARAADLDAAVALEAAVFGESAWSPRSMEQEFRVIDRCRCIVVADNGPNVVGYAALRYSGDSADVQRVVVAQAWQRQGIGGRMLAALAEHARASYCAQLLLEVAADNLPARGLYTAHGFMEISRRSRYYAQDVDAIVMARRLDAQPLSETGV